MGDRKEERRQEWEEVRSARLLLKDCHSGAKDTWMFSSFFVLFFLKGLFLESCTQACCLYFEVQPLYYQASCDLTLLNEVID